MKKTEEADIDKLIELTERDGNRMFLKGAADNNATEKLRERKAYVLCQVVTKDDEEVA